MPDLVHQWRNFIYFGTTSSMKFLPTSRQWLDQLNDSERLEPVKKVAAQAEAIMKLHGLPAICFDDDGVYRLVAYEAGFGLERLTR